MAKRSYGTGHLHEKHGSWYGQGRRSDGSQFNRKLGPGGRNGLSKKEAERALRAILADESASIRATARTSVEDLGSRLIVRLEARGRKTSHVRGARSHLRVHIEPYFVRQELAVEQVDETEVARFVAILRRRGLNPKTVHNIVATLHAMFALAVRDKLVVANPVDLSAVPASSNSSRRIRFLTRTELEALLRAEPEPTNDWWPRDRSMWLVAAMTGLRLGELLGLRWCDVDWTAMRLRVSENMVHGESATPKSGKSRSVPMTDRVGRELELHFQRCLDFQADEELVFGRLDGGRQLPAAPLKRFKRALKRAGLASTHVIHDLRHTFGTTCAASGISMRTVQEWMGHADFQTTLIYAAYAPATHEREWIGRAFAEYDTAEGREANGKQSPANSDQEEQRGTAR